MTTAPARNSDRGGCPPAEELSAWFDGESSDSLEPHVRVCSHCQRVVRTYRSIAMVIRTAAQAPDGLPERIINNCRASREESRPTVITFPRLAATAAAVVLLAGLGVAAWRNLETNSPDGFAARRTPAPPRSSAPAKATESAFSEVAEGNVTPLPSSPEPPSGRTVYSDQIAPAGTQIAGMSAGSGRIRAQRIPDRVLHVWVVQNLEQGRRFLMAHLPRDASVASEQSGRQMQEFVVRIRDDRLPTLVRELSGAGWRLMSPTPPQPDAPGRVAWIVRRRAVEYRLRVVAQPNSGP